MDAKGGRYLPEDSPLAEPEMPRIKVGEIVKVKRIPHEVVSFGERTITLRMLSAEERRERRISSVSSELSKRPWTKSANKRRKRRGKR